MSTTSKKAARPLCTLIITAHKEGLLLGATIKSLLACEKFAGPENYSFHKVIYLDNADQETKDIAYNAEKCFGFSIVETEYADQGKVRNQAASEAQDGFIAFLDGDDIWSENWLSKALATASQNKNYIVHPEFNWFFGGSNNILHKIDQDSQLFSKNFLRTGNYWDALCLAHRDIFTHVPYSARDIATGFAFEDWHWNCETIQMGYKHKIAEDTIHFKRRRANSQTIAASKRKVLMRDTNLIHFDNAD
ncbi:glycosyltransferase family A protein [Biformimicrobium ophioploci]|uniref:Glycosyltransferase family A protein n=1 Tax=Biformimicrobium ophioploci TaxID=3036711 RepID=A0ABQ6M1U6_9GAMM|nr:glycosyltransferase family A protein [Microbulbifer sp. NKW57]GMG88323.1 glycosyltransferase family A protein [Microbulbifer sp. NKW57]